MGKLNSRTYEKVYTPSPSRIYPWDLRTVQLMQINKLIYHINKMRDKNYVIDQLASVSGLFPENHLIIILIKKNLLLTAPSAHHPLSCNVR